MKFKKESKEIITPTRAHATDAGLDIYSPDDFIVMPNTISARINLGVGFEIPWGYVGLIVERSSQGAKGIDAKKGMVVDYGYTGFVHVTITNDSEDPIYIKKGDRICQLLLVGVRMENLEEVTEFDKTERGEGSHGSSGI